MRGRKGFGGEAPAEGAIEGEVGAMRGERGGGEAGQDQSRLDQTDPYNTIRFYSIL